MNNLEVTGACHVVVSRKNELTKLFKESKEEEVPSTLRPTLRTYRARYAARYALAEHVTPHLTHLQSMLRSTRCVPLHGRYIRCCIVRYLSPLHTTMLVKESHVTP